MSFVDRWATLRLATPARIGLGRAGSALTTREVVRLAIAEAEARDAVWAPWDIEAAAIALKAAGADVMIVRTGAPSRADYLKRPDLGRTLASGERERLEACREGADVVLAMTNGLSSTAVTRHGPALGLAMRSRLAEAGMRAGPMVLARDGRVAWGDAVGAALGAKLIIVIVGERPGLSASDSLGIYLTYAPASGTTDERRNCISNVRPDGLPIEPAAAKAVWLARQALARQLSGVSLKDEAPVFGSGDVTRLDR